MSNNYSAIMSWARGNAPFTDMQYSRAHTWHFDGGATVPASSSPHHVRIPFSDPSAVDPEEAYVASLSSCHMLSFLYVAAKRGMVVDRYDDDAEGTMGTDANGRQWIERVTLRPRVTFATPCDADLEAEMHHAAHDACYIANSVRTNVVVEPRR